ncbi:MAG TPA: helix-turn-helix domain-containing protein [Hyphomicrobiaceae bacterium]|nr:helix-turn-helix domain-containing protein [Hyphomicrobiaceae bacterium]
MSFAVLLKDWRRRRGLSQLGLSVAADVSARHIAFIETGRARPTRGMILRLSDALDIPRRDRNGLLEAAGFASAYAARDLGAADMLPIRQAVDWMLERHAPFPAIALTRHWVIAALNAPAAAMFGPLGIATSTCLIETFMTPGPLRDAIENWQEVAAHLLARLKTESRASGGDSVLDGAALRLAAEAGDPIPASNPLPPFLTTRIAVGDLRLALLSTIAQFGSAEDIALAELRIELFFPADEPTRELLSSRSAGLDAEKSRSQSLPQQRR